MREALVSQQNVLLLINGTRQKFPLTKFEGISSATKCYLAFSREFSARGKELQMNVWKIQKPRERFLAEPIPSNFASRNLCLVPLISNITFC